jgi:tetratricopeptide (TPR) repeat protein
MVAALLVVMLAPPATAKRARGFDRDHLREGYRLALARWVSGEQDLAVADLVELEAAAVAAAEKDVYEALRRVELSVARGLMSRGVEILAPLAVFHESVYLAHLERRAVPLALHSRLLVVELVETYARQGPGVIARSFASDALASLGGHLQEARIEGPAADLYSRAVELDAKNSTALLALAVLRERHGDSDRAVPHLRRLLEVEPGHREGALRLAINSLRLGGGAEGEGMLRSLAEGGPADWIRSLAYQELAKVIAAREEWGTAQQLLAGAVARIPDDPTLAIQLAYVSERSGVDYPEAALVAALERAAAQPALSPRFRYIRIPYERLDDLRRDLRARSEPYVAELGAALGIDPGRVETGP